MGWIRCNLKGAEVFARARADGSLDVSADGRVDVKYKLVEGAKVYRASARNLERGADTAPVASTPRTPRPAPPADAVIVYTDGACTGNPGPMGLGVVVRGDGEPRELSEYLGIGTNNIAELTAIERAADILTAAEREREVFIHTDSSYAIGVLSLGWKAKANTELIARIRGKLARLPRVHFVKVAGHAGIADNERCDELARAAVVRRT